MSRQLIGKSLSFISKGFSTPAKGETPLPPPPKETLTKLSKDGGSAAALVPLAEDLPGVCSSLPPSTIHRVCIV